eukprot:636626-Rhodomonas_salina.1
MPGMVRACLYWNRSRRTARASGLTGKHAARSVGAPEVTALVLRLHIRQIEHVLQSWPRNTPRQKIARRRSAHVGMRPPRDLKAAVSL